MTAQIGDRFLYGGDHYSIVAISNSIQFDPSDYGIKPAACCTACWNGYWCDYRISSEGITLQNLYINSEEDCYPKINGISPENDDGKHFKYMGHHLYKNINIFMEYTGRILAGKDFMREYYIHMGYQRAWAYKVLTEWIFDGGRLVKTVDHSEMAEKLRKELEVFKDKKENGKADRDIVQFVQDSFSLDMREKAWWIKQREI